MKKIIYLLLIILIVPMVLCSCGESRVYANSISFNFDKLNCYGVGDEFFICSDDYSIEPSNFNLPVYFRSENQEVVSVDKLTGKVICKSSGTAKIIAMANSGYYNTVFDEFEINILPTAQFSKGLEAKKSKIILPQNAQFNVYDYITILPLNTVAEPTITFNDNSLIENQNNYNYLSVKAGKTEMVVSVPYGRKTGEIYQQKINLEIRDMVFATASPLVSGTINNLAYTFTDTIGNINVAMTPSNSNAYYFECESSLISVDENGAFETKSNTGRAIVKLFYFFGIEKTDLACVEINIDIKLGYKNEYADILTYDLQQTNILLYDATNVIYKMVLRSNVDMTVANFVFPINLFVGDKIISSDNKELTALVYANNVGENLNFEIKYAQFDSFSNKYITINIKKDVINKSDINISFTYNSNTLLKNANKYTLYLINAENVSQNLIIHQYYANINITLNNEIITNYSVNTNALNLLLVNNGVVNTNGQVGEEILKLKVFGGEFSIAFVIEKVLVADFEVLYTEDLYYGVSADTTNVSIVANPIYSYNKLDYNLFTSCEDLQIDNVNKSIKVIAKTQDCASVTISCGEISKVININLFYGKNNLKFFVSDNEIENNTITVDNNSESVIIKTCVYNFDVLLLYSDGYSIVEVNNNGEDFSSGLLNINSNQFSDSITIELINSGTVYVKIGIDNELFEIIKIIIN